MFQLPNQCQRSEQKQQLDSSTAHSLQHTEQQSESSCVHYSGEQRNRNSLWQPSDWQSHNQGGVSRAGAQGAKPQEWKNGVGTCQKKTLQGERKYACSPQVLTCLVTTLDSTVLVAEISIPRDLVEPQSCLQNTNPDFPGFLEPQTT